MPAAVIGGAIAAVGSIGAAALGSSAQNRATREATAATERTTTANNALTREIYGENKAVLAPFVNNGTSASNAINALLGLAPTPMPAPANTNLPQGFAPTQQQGYPAGGRNPLGRYFSGGPGGISYAQYLNGEMPEQNQPAPAPTPAQPPAGTVPAASPYQQAFDNYRNSTGYQFRYNQGMDALNTGWAARGMLNSGAAIKSAQEYGQNIASGEFGNYLNALGNQQGVGLSAAGAQAGVGTNYANTISANNNALASVQANAALARGQNTANMWGTAASALGQIGGSVFSSYGRGY